MAYHIAKPVDSAPDKTERVKAFGREHGWLCAGAFAAILIATAEGRLPENSELAQNRQAISQLSSDDLKDLRLQAVAYRQLSRPEQEAVRSVHQELKSHPEYDDTVSRYHRWYESLPKEQRDRIAAAKTDIERLTVIRELREPSNYNGNNRISRPDNEPQPGWNNDRFRPFGMRDLVFRLSQRGRPTLLKQVVKDLANAVNLPVPPANASELEQWESHIRIIETAMTKLPAAGEKSIHDIMLKVRDDFIGDEPKQRGQNDAGRPLEMLSVGIVTEGLFVISKDEKLKQQLWLKLPPEMRRELQSLPTEEGNLHIVIEHVRTVSDELHRRLSRQFFGDEPGGPGGRPRGPDRNGNGGFRPRPGEPEDRPPMGEGPMRRPPFNGPFNGKPPNDRPPN